MEIITKNVQSSFYSWSLDLLIDNGVSVQVAHVINSLLLITIVALLLYGVDYLLRRVFMILMIRYIRKSPTRFDDFLIHNKVLKYFCHLIPILIAKQLLPLIFMGFPNWTKATLKLTDILLIINFALLINGIFRTVKDTLKTKKRYADKPLDSYFQVITIVVFFICGIIIFSSLTGNSPWEFLISLGAASAILMLVFKDTILGFVASIQVSTNDMVRVGDWIEMSKFGADGTVLEINLSTVKVQNFDKTITTIPTYLLISDSFKNYRGMQKSGGRRIKRAINIKMSSIRFLQPEEIEKLKKIQLLAPYIEERQSEIDQFNEATLADATMPVNGRKMTNIGLFREYVKRYAGKNPNIHKQYHLMVRHLQPTEHGLPLELYMFTNTTEWAVYEGIMADLFDHLFAAIKFFDLEIFELPASDDVRKFNFKNSLE
ncbi:mechanosensitive ion channel [Myroides ceti]|uniref:Mechanosensitive ion channel n=2 Tax=Paenimyroides ceti TaxID=395087 RepID=A0ABT8CQY3_9FLAO|nr:mechanosensitive ion channel domain-containing protein [Paenimyroides ceti]MDN3705610.1 mechanosensitive ion channel [Paenimyroides ceti]